MVKDVPVLQCRCGVYVDSKITNEEGRRRVMLYKLFNSAMIKMAEIARVAGGWILTFVAFIISYIGDGVASFCIVSVVVMFDAALGISSAVKRGGFFLSYLARESVFKLLVYLLILFVVLMIERTLSSQWTIATPMISAVICAIELWSILAHILILKPDFPLALIFRKYLEGEIARKLSLDKSDVAEILSPKEPAKEEGEDE